MKVSSFNTTIDSFQSPGFLDLSFQLIDGSLMVMIMILQICRTNICTQSYRCQGVYFFPVYPLFVHLLTYSIELHSGWFLQLLQER